MSTSSSLRHEPVTGPAVWTGEEIGARPETWRVTLTPEHVAELLGGGELTTLAPVLRSLVDELVDGRGFVLIRGVPVDGLSDSELERIWWTIGLHLGTAIPQNDAGDLLVHVRDEGLDFANPEVRAYQTAARLDYHSDSSDVVGLLCVRPAREGGVSTIVSSGAVFNAALERRPDLADELLGSWWWDRRKQDLTQSFFQRRIFADDRGSMVSYYGRAHIESATRGENVPALTSRQVEVLDLLDELANDPAFVLNMSFQPGDIQFLNNYKIWHARTHYVDHDDPARKRDLIRLWLRVDADLHLPDDFAVGGITARTVNAT